jgi:hypothetical protein
MGIKRSRILRRFQKCAAVLSLTKVEKKFYRITDFVGTFFKMAIYLFLGLYGGFPSVRREPQLSSDKFKP